MFTRVFFIVVFLLSFSSSAHAENACVYNPAQKLDKPLYHFQRGVNLTGWLENWNDKGLLNNEDIANIKKLGFSFVRLPVGPKHLEVVDSELQKKILSELRCDIIRLLNNDLSVVLDLHPPKSFHERLAAESSDSQLAHLTKLWKTLAVVAKELPTDRLYLNLLNEPTEKIQNWWKLQGELIKSLRTYFPEHVFIVSSYYNKKLYKEEPYAYSGLIYDLHFYSPHFYTHHGAEWDPTVDPREKSDDIDYPVTNQMRADADYKKMKEYLNEGWNKQKLREQIELNVDWAKKNSVKMMCLEFGVYRPYVVKEGRTRWLMDVRHILEEFGVPWALWNYNGDDFGLIDPRGEVDQDMLKALGLGPVVAP